MLSRRFVCVLALAPWLTVVSVAPGQPQFVDPLDDLAKQIVAEIERMADGKKDVKVAMFAFGDQDGGFPEKDKAALCLLHSQFLSRLAEKMAQKGFVLGPDAIDHELRARKKAIDPAKLNPKKASDVAEWLRDSFNGEVHFAVLGRVEIGAVGKVDAPERTEGNATLTLIATEKPKEGKQFKEFKAVLDGGTGSFFDKNAPAVRVALYARERGEKDKEGKRHPIPLYWEKEEKYALAVIPQELEKALDRGELGLEIDLVKSKFTLKDMELSELNPEGDRYTDYILADAPKRVFPVAVSVDGRGTIAEEIDDYANRGKKRPAYVARPPEQLRKWVMTLPGYAVEGASSTDQSPVVQPVTKGGHSTLTIKGFQDSATAGRLFALRRPSVGQAEAMGISSTPGVIRISVFAQKQKEDKILRQKVLTGYGPKGAVGIGEGNAFENKVTTVKVHFYNACVEEHVILLCTRKQHDPKEEKLEEYPPAVTK